MKWTGILLISALWGGLSTRLFLQAGLSAVNFFITFLGFVKGAVPRKDNALGMGVNAFSAVMFSLLLGGGFWLLTEVLSFGYTKAENVVYWVFAGLSALFMLPQIPSKIRNSWRCAMIPGALNASIFDQKYAAEWFDQDKTNSRPS